MADPGTGILRFNNATLSSVTAIAMSALTAASGYPNIRSFISTWGASNDPVKGQIAIRKIGAPATFAQFNVTAVVTDNTTWEQVTVAYVAGSGTFSASDSLSVQFTRSGDTGMDASLIPNHLSGLTLSTAGSSATFSVAMGAANDSTNVDFLKLASAYSKTTSAWAVGSGNGALDTGAIAANTWYHAYLIKRPDTGVVDVLISLSATSPTMPANYTLFRRIGSMKTNGSSQWIKFIQVGDEFILDAPVADQSAVALSASSLYTLASVPTGVNVRANFISNYQSNTAGSYMLVQSPLVTSQTINSPSGNLTNYVPVVSTPSVLKESILTNTSGQVRAVSNGVGTITWTVVTTGWIDSRGK
ncbi:hypothetical protein CO669_25350 [Bradyrhizobium sp. Y36]|nr:hypothetical protein CO669_25350 [Bradyrhizobium sp. Y36]